MLEKLRRSGDHVRITAQLVDAETGAHRWAERYDRKLDNVFAIQDEVVRSIAPLLVAHVTKAEVERTLLKPPTTWQAYHYFMRGLDLHLSYQSSQEVLALREARRLLEQSISIDPSRVPQRVGGFPFVVLGQLWRQRFPSAFCLGAGLSICPPSSSARPSTGLCPGDVRPRAELEARA